MDVSLWYSRVFLTFLALTFLISCGNRYDLGEERGRRARIDDANFYLSRGQCDSALDAIGPVYSSQYVDDEVRIIMASAYACRGGFNALTLISNLSGATNYFQVLAKTMANSAGRVDMYNAMDVLSFAGTKMNANVRSASVNTYMALVQLGVIGSILRAYGNPSSTGAQGSNLIYDTIAGTLVGEMADADACALAAAFAVFQDSYRSSSFSDGDTAAVNTSLNAVCVAAGSATCSLINKDRTQCDGTNADTVTANAVVTQVNTSW